MHLVGVYLNKGRIANVIFFIPIFGIMFLCEPFLLAIKLNPEVAALAQQYCYGLYAALFFQAQVDATKNYLNSIRESRVVTALMFAAMFYHALTLYFFVDVFEWGIIGCSWGTMVTYLLNFILVTTYCGLRSDLRESFFFPTSECFENMWDYFKIGLPASAMISLEWWSNELQAVMASYLSVVQGGAMVILINTLTTLSMIPMGGAIACTVFVGSSLGEGRPLKAKLY